MKNIYKLFFLFYLLFLFPRIGLAQSQEKINSFHADITINTNGTIDISEKIDYFFSDYRHGIYRYLPYLYEDESGKKFKLNFSDFSTKYVDGTQVPFKKSTDGNNILLKIGDPDKTLTGPKTYLINYSAKGAINYFDDYDELYWNVTGNDWAANIEKSSATVILPESTDYNSIKARCLTGEYGSKEEDCTIQKKDNRINFSSKEKSLTVVVGWNKGVVEFVAKDYNFFSNLSPTALLAIHLLPLIIPITTLIIMIKKIKRKGGIYDHGYTITPEFAPPKNINPAEMGVIMDSKVDPSDLTSEIINFAVKGIIKIKELKKRVLRSQDYELIVDKGLPSNAKAYEKDIFNEIFRGNRTVKLSQLKQRTDAYSGFNAINDKLYEQMKTEGYFVENPHKVRNRYLAIGMLVIILAGASFWYTGLMISLILTGLIIAISGRYMPKRTPKGQELARKIVGFKEFISKAEKYRAKWAEKENLFFSFLPYAVLFGVTNKWAKAFKDISVKQPDWYEGNWHTFNTVIFASSLSSFNSSWQTSSRGSAAAGNASGFSSSGGFSGGGFGGGGGGSW